MKVLLRNTETGLFYAGADHWTELHAEATDFKRPDAALEEVSASSLSSVEVVMHFENPVFDLPLTIFNAGTAAC